MGFGLNNKLVLHVFSTAAMRARFDDTAMLQGWLETERGLAVAQGELGITPAEPARVIAANCDASLYDLSALAGEILETGHPLVPVIRSLIRKSGEAGKFAHWGATTQDIVDTGVVLQCREGLKLVAGDIRLVLDQLVPVARKYRDQPMAERTHFQHASPVTFGKKVAIWIDDLTAALHRIEAVQAGLTGQLAGAVGTLAALKGRGPETRDRMCRVLGLKSAEVPWHTTRGRFRDISNALLEYAAPAERIGIEITLMMATELQEAGEPISDRHVGSSTMPQKRNPHTSEFMITGARMTRGEAAPLIAHSAHSFEREMTCWAIEWVALPQMFCLASGIGQNLIHITDGLVVSPRNMERVLALTNGQIMAESAMMRLADAFGHEGAHEVMYECANISSREGRNLEDVLLADRRVREHLSPEAIAAAMDPAAYLGDSGTIVDAAVAAAEKAMKR